MKNSSLKILTVCSGNICRSPMAVSVLRARLEAAGLGESVSVESTATTPSEVGNRIDRRAAQTLLAAGYDPLPNHRAREVTIDQLLDSDLVLPMTAAHARVLRRLWADTSSRQRSERQANEPQGNSSQSGTTPRSAAGQNTKQPIIRMYRTFDPATGASAEQWNDDLDDWDIADPWYGDSSDFEVTLAELEAGADAIVDFVRQALEAEKKP